MQPLDRHSLVNHSRTFLWNTQDVQDFKAYKSKPKFTYTNFSCKSSKHKMIQCSIYEYKAKLNIRDWKISCFSVLTLALLLSTQYRIVLKSLVHRHWTIMQTTGGIRQSMLRDPATVFFREKRRRKWFTAGGTHN